MSGITELQTSLCKGLRACGIPKAQSLELVNTVSKWYRESGPEWTNSRIKDLRQWYETTLTGEPKPPEWFKHSKDGYPVGIWSWVFKLPIAKALGVLSLNTTLYERSLSASQKEKFLHGLEGNGNQDLEYLKKMLKAPFSWFASSNCKVPKIQFPTLFDMTGSIPVHEGQSTVHSDETLATALKALRLSWADVPQVTFDFLDHQNLLGYMPVSVVGNDYQLELNRPHSPIVGRVSVLQQPQLKARIVGNPNRVLQVTLEPLKSVYMTALRNLPTDVTHDQESGVHWVQDMLRQGIELAGSDLTSASDLLDVRCCLYLIDFTFGFQRLEGYKDYEHYFYEVSRASWYCPALGCNVQWKQGDVLGTGPSFGLLSLTNNAAALAALYQARSENAIDRSISWTDSFRVVGDDIVMRAELQPYYTRIIEALGGEINHSKTLKSDKVAEFAGRVITSNGRFLKAIKYSEPSDNSFMSYVAQLGDQAKYLLKPRQRRVYELYKQVPGIVVDGPWMQDSYGVALGPRYQWYLEEVLPALSRVEPDLPLSDYSMVLLKAQLSLTEAGETWSSSIQLDEPLHDEGYLPSQVTPTFKVGGDPRLTKGKTQLDVLSEHLKLKDITPFEDWIMQENLTTSQMSEELDLPLTSDSNAQSRGSTGRGLESPSLQPTEGEELGLDEDDEHDLLTR